MMIKMMMIKIKVTKIKNQAMIKNKINLT